MSTPHTHLSPAFASLVEHPDDLVGLIAYALFKQGRLESHAADAFDAAMERALSPTETQIYRGEAERRLTLVVSSAIQDATPNIVERALRDSVSDTQTIMLGAVTAAAERVTATVTRQTSVRAAIIVNLVAWVISLAITVLIVQAFYLPNWQTELVAQIAAVLHAANQVPAPSH